MSFPVRFGTNVMYLLSTNCLVQQPQIILFPFPVVNKEAATDQPHSIDVCA